MKCKIIKVNKVYSKERYEYYCKFIGKTFDVISCLYSSYKHDSILSVVLDIPEYDNISKMTEWEINEVEIIKRKKIWKI